MKKVRLLLILFFITQVTFSQTEKVKIFYNNGQLKSKGKVLTYKTHEHKELNCHSKTIKKKKGVWKYYNPIGQLIRIENYKAIIDCDKISIPIGKWQYWNEQGILYREDIFKNGAIQNSVIEIFKDTVSIGEIIINNFQSDTILTLEDKNRNLIVNPDFNIFKYKPILLFDEGKSKIEDWIPFWNTPGDFTPDYFNPFRKIKNLNIFSSDSIENNKFYSYIGLGLYQNNTNYSEFIQGKLKSRLDTGRLYCLKLHIKLSSYSGFSIDNVGVLFSNSPFELNNKNIDEYKPQINLYGLGDSNEWKLKCKIFVADGSENYITVGRFEPSNNVAISKMKPELQSSFGLDQAAYYLLDKIELYSVGSISDCNCTEPKIIQLEINSKETEAFDSLQYEEFEQLDTNKAIILKNVNFEFNKYELLRSSEKDLVKLYNFLKRNGSVSIEIIGHTDNFGSISYNLELSEKRARAVYIWLVEKGVSEERLSYKSYGKSRPLINNKTEENRLKNRRVEFKIKGKFN